MSIFGSIYNGIFGSADAAPATPAPDAPNATETTSTLSPASSAAPTAQAAQPSSGTPAQTVDVTDILSKKADERGEDLNWQTSIVDLLKLLDLDSSLSARRQLANELNVHVAGDGSEEENIALLHAVMNKLAQNGGTIPADLKG